MENDKIFIRIKRTKIKKIHKTTVVLYKIYNIDNRTNVNIVSNVIAFKWFSDIIAKKR